MQDDFSQMMTPFDQSISSRPLQMTKLLLPFLPPQVQRVMAIYIKFMEFQNTLTYFNGLHSASNAPLEELKKMLPPSAAETYENLMNMVNMMSMFQEMQGTSEFDFDPASMMADMFSMNPKEGDSND